MSTGTNGVSQAAKIKGLRTQLQKMNGDAEAMLADIKAKQREHGQKVSAIAKLKEEIQALEQSNPIEFGTRVKTPNGEGIYLGRDSGTYTIAMPHGSQFNFCDYTRDQFTVITE